MVNKARIIVYSGIFSIICLLITGCSFPRIIFIDNELTPDEYIALGVAYEQKGQYEEAIKAYESASKKSDIAYFYLGNVYFQKNDLRTAEKYYKKAIIKNPEHADAYNNLAWLYYIKRENLAEAQSLAEKAIELNPDKRAAYLDTLEKIREIK